MKSSLFILGSTRSGTSALRNAIVETRFNGAGEGHTIALLGALFETIQGYWRKNAAALAEGTMLAEWRQDDFWKDIVAIYLKQIKSVFPGDYYLDKTPNIFPIQYIHLIESALPAPLFLFCRRNGIDNVISKVRKWPETTFEAHCQEWADVINAWDDVKSSLSSPWIEIDYFDLWSEPAKTAMRIGTLLSLDEGDVAKLTQQFDNGRPAKAPGIALETTGWSKSEKRLFRKVCGPVMQRHKYGYDSYWEA